MCLVCEIQLAREIYEKPILHMRLLKLSWQCENVELQKNHSDVIFYLCYLLSCNTLCMCSNYFALESHNFDKYVLIYIVMNQFVVYIVICQLL